MTMILRRASGTPSSRVTLSPIVICSFSAGTRKTHVNASSAPGPVPGGRRCSAHPACEQRERPERHRDDHDERGGQDDLTRPRNAVERDHDASRSLGRRMRDLDVGCEGDRQLERLARRPR